MIRKKREPLTPEQKEKLLANLAKARAVRAANKAKQTEKPKPPEQEKGDNWVGGHTLDKEITG